jgi:phage shock protein E
MRLPARSSKLFHKIAATILASGVVWISAVGDEAKPAATSVTPAAGSKLLAERKDVVPLDVRSAKDFGEGHISGAINIDSRVPDFRERLAKLDKSKTYLVHCVRGLKRTTDTVSALQDLGFRQIVVLEGGVNAWEKDGLPVEK